MWRTLSLVAGPALLVITGLLHGVWTERWGRSADVEQFTARLAGVPPTIGDWTSKGDRPMDEAVQRMAGITGYVQRDYVNRRGVKVSVLLVCGPSGPISVHTPDVCYPGSGFAQRVPETRDAVPYGEEGAAASFWTSRFRRPDPVAPEYLRIFWAWNANGEWESPDNPRFAFARYRALYKLYVVRQLAKEDEPLADDPAKQFLALLLPELQRCLFPPTD